MAKKMTVEVIRMDILFSRTYLGKGEMGKALILHKGRRIPRLALMASDTRRHIGVCLLHLADME